MKKINFELCGMFGAMEFGKGANVKSESEEILKNLVKSIEKVTLCDVVNDQFVIDIQDVFVCGENEKDITYKFILETSIPSDLLDKDILALIHKKAKCVEKNLPIVVVAPDEYYDYEIISG